MAGLAVLVNHKGLPRLGFFSYFQLALYHKWGVKNGFTFALQFFMLLSESLGGV
jgi:hypothetical protein